MAKHVMGEFLSLIAAKFTDPDGEKWSQERIGEAMGLSQTQVSEVMRGKNAGITFLLALSKHTGKTMNQLLGPTAPVSERIEEVTAHAVVAAAEYIELRERRGMVYDGPSPIGAKYRAMKECVEAARKRGDLWLRGPDPELATEAHRAAERAKKRSRKAS